MASGTGGLAAAEVPAPDHLATAIVIHCAWRRAVRDAGVDAVHEDRTGDCYDPAVEDSPHVRAGIDDCSFLIGLVGLIALLYVADSAEALPVVLDRQSMDPIVTILIVTANAGWAGLAYACWFRSGRITGTALTFVLALGVCGMAISVFALVVGQPSHGDISVLLVDLTGTWILNGLGIVWIVDKVRRIRVASNADAAAASQ